MYIRHPEVSRDMVTERERERDKERGRERKRERERERECEIITIRAFVIIHSPEPHCMVLQFYKML